VAGRPSNRSRLAAIAVVLALASPGARAIAETPSDQVRLPPNAQIGDYVGQDVMIPMRDGVKLHAEIWRPRGAAGRLPILMQRSPYGFGMARVGAAFATEYRQLAKDGYIFVLEDIRGRFGSEGEFVMLRPPARAGGVDESTDAYDSIDWLVKSLPDASGAVGVFGISYLGWTAAMATRGPTPPSRRCPCRPRRRTCSSATTSITTARSGWITDGKPPPRSKATGAP